MTWNKNHPARSHEFLSRLHDGDLSPAERAHFESHRAHCADCRTSAAEYERALSLFRSARSSPAPADMANRVLRKVQSAGRSRWPPISSFFSVDWRWAGAFAAALLVLLIAAPIVLRQQSGMTTPEGPISIAMQDKETAPSAAPASPELREEAQRQLMDDERRPAAQKPAASTDSRSPARSPASTAGSALDNTFVLDGVNADQAARAKNAPEPKAETAAAAGRAQAPAASPQAGFIGQSQASDKLAVQNKTNQRAAATWAQAPAQAQAQAQEKSGGEGAREQVLVSGETPVLDRPSRLIVQQLDGEGSPPELDVRPEEPDLIELRGRSFVLLVDASGHVRDVRETALKAAPAPELKRRDAGLAKEKDSTVDPLKRVRFKPGERPRRLLVRVE
jgi:hypothetical protein